MVKFWNTWNKKDETPKEAFTNTNTVNNFYGKETIGQQTTRFHFIHFVLKYKILIPLLLLIRKIIGKRMVKKVGEEPQFTYVKLFEEITDKATTDWAHIYLNSLRKKHKRLSRAKWEERYHNDKNSSLFFIRTTKELATTIAVNDDAYTEYMTFFLWETYFRMQKLVDSGVKDHLMRNVPGTMNPIHEMIYLQLLKGHKEGKIHFTVTKAGKQK